MKHLLLPLGLLLAAALAPAGQAQRLAPFSPADLEGTWASAGCETLELGGQTSFLKRQFSFTRRTWELRFTLYADPMCSAPLLSSRLSGPYRLTGAAPLPGTQKVTWGQTAKFIAPLAPPLLETMNAAGCGSPGLSLGQERDVGVTGCLALGTPSVEAYGQEYDLLRLEGGRLFTGLREPEMNLEVNRPTQIFEFPLRRQ